MWSRIRRISHYQHVSHFTLYVMVSPYVGIWYRCYCFMALWNLVHLYCLSFYIHTSCIQLYCAVFNPCDVARIVSGRTYYSIGVVVPFCLDVNWSWLTGYVYVQMFSFQPLFQLGRTKFLNLYIRPTCIQIFVYNKPSLSKGTILSEITDVNVPYFETQALVLN